MQHAPKLHFRLDDPHGLAQLLDLVLDHLAVGLVILDAELRIRWSNRVGMDILTAGTSLQLRDGRLSPGSAEARAQLGELIAEAIAGDAGASRPKARRRWQSGLFRLDDGTEEAVFGFVAPLLPDRALTGQVGAPLVLLALQHRQSRLAPSERQLADLFGLTPAEARLTAELAQGRRLEEVAEKRSVTLNTVRSQARSAMAKIGVSRQAELVSLLCRIPFLELDQVEAGKDEGS